jgi:hypothetical protein
MTTKNRYRSVTVGFVSIAALILLSSMLAARSQTGLEAAFLVEIREGTMDLSRQGTSGRGCILVLPDGRFHLEIRSQHPGSAAAILSVFDYSLDSGQLQKLRGLLDNDRIRQLPAYAQPPLPMAVPWSHGFSVKIARSTGVQNVGYWIWRGGTLSGSPNSAPESVKRGWQESEAALQPLTDWFHSIEALKLSPSGTGSTMCAADAN